MSGGDGHARCDGEGHGEILSRRKRQSPLSNPDGIQWRDGYLYVADNMQGLLRVDPRTGCRTLIDGTLDQPSSLVFVGDDICIAEGQVLRSRQASRRTSHSRWSGAQPAHGRVVFDARFLAEGVETYRAYRMPWSARPAERPRAVATATGRITTVRVSWNGATDVSRWRVRRTDTGATVTAARRGFETSLRLNGRPRTVVAEGLDASGAVLGRTAPTAVRHAGG